MDEFENNITALLQQAFDALVVTEDSEIFDFEDEEEEAESAPIQYACRKIMEVIDLINAPVIQQRYLCGCVSCICEDDVQCQGCGATACKDYKGTTCGCAHRQEEMDNE